MTRIEFLNTYWLYYLSLEEDFLNSIRFNSLCENNFKSISVEYSRLMQSICSEIDVIFKEIYNIPKESFSTIKDYYNEVVKLNKSFLKEEVQIVKYLLTTIKPLEKWEKEKPPFWWNSYNNIKHNRYQMMQDANQKNVLYSLASLYLLNNYLLLKLVKGTDEKDIVDEESKIFRLNWERKNVSFTHEVFAEILVNDSDSFKEFP